MVCDRCILSVSNLFEKYDISQIKLGEVRVSMNIPNYEEKLIIEKLKKIGFEILVSKNTILSNKIKSIIIEIINNSNENEFDLKRTLEKHLNKNYTNLNKIFKEQEKLTIHKYYLMQKMNKAKELLTYGERSIKEIAFILNFKSVEHFSRSFKKLFGQSPKSYRTNPKDRIPIDKIIN